MNAFIVRKCSVAGEPQSVSDPMNTTNHLSRDSRRKLSCLEEQNKVRRILDEKVWLFEILRRAMHQTPFAIR